MKFFPTDDYVIGSVILFGKYYFLALHFFVLFAAFEWTKSNTLLTTKKFDLRKFIYSLFVFFFSLSCFKFI